MVNAKPYLRNTWLNLRNLWEYKWDFFGDFVRYPVTIALHLIIFSFLYANTSTIQGYSRAEGFTYILVVSLISRSLSQVGLAQIMQQKIIEGELITDLAIPVDISLYLTSKRLGYPIYLTVISIITYILAAQLFPTVIIMPVLWRAVVAIIFAFSAMFLQMQLFYLIGLLAFWLRDVRFVINIASTLRGFLGGRYIPLTWFPPLLLQIALFLPFSQMYYFPVIIFLGKEQIAVYLLVLQLLLWLVVMQLIIKFVEKRGLEHFQGEGG